MRLIGLCGYAGAGKDAAAGFLVREHGFTRVAFADPLRQWVYAQNPIIDFAYDDACKVRTVRLRELVDRLGWDIAKREYREIRELLQRTGTEAGREIMGPDFWVNIGMERARAAGTAVVFTDCRFDSEFNAVLNAGGEIWEIARPGVAAVNMHASEQWTPPLGTRTVLNYGALADLGTSVFGAVCRG